VLAYRFGFASILGAFAAGLLVRMIDLEGRAPHPQFETKLQGIGFGFLIPIFFIATGVQFDLPALLGHPAALAEVPLFLIALLVVRGLPGLLYTRLVGRRRAAVAGLMQATTLTFVIVATQVGLATGHISSHRRLAARRRAAVCHLVPACGDATAGPGRPALPVSRSQGTSRAQRLGQANPVGHRGQPSGIRRAR
jgi:Kef-type K+ transport system membrane component KefB